MMLGRNSPRASEPCGAYSRRPSSPHPRSFPLMTNQESPDSKRFSFAERLGFHRPELRAWVMYDWANSAMVTTVVAAVFPIYYGRVAGANIPEADATYRFTMITVVAMVIVALIAPVLGAVADFSAVK